MKSAYFCKMFVDRDESVEFNILSDTFKIYDGSQIVSEEVHPLVSKLLSFFFTHFFRFVFENHVFCAFEEFFKGFFFVLESTYQLWTEDLGPYRFDNEKK